MSVSLMLPQFSAVFSFWNLLGVVVTLLYIYWWRRPHVKFPPGPRGLPLVGVLPYMGKNPATEFKKWSLEKYGPVMSARIGRQEVVILNNFEAVNQALVKQSAMFSDRPFVTIFCSLTGRKGIAFKQYDDAFKFQKHFGLKFLREKGMARKKMEETVNEEGDMFVEFVRKHGNKPLNIKRYLYWMTSNIISKVVFGKRHEYDDPVFTKLLDALAMIFSDPETAERTGLINQYNFLANVPWFKYAMDKLNTRMQLIVDYMKASIKEHKERFNPSNVDDLVDSLLYEAKFGKPHTKPTYTDEQIMVYCRDMFMGGTETSSTTLSWCFVFLLNYPEYYKLIEDEINETLGMSGIPSMSKKDQMPFTSAFLQEVMRHKTLAPLSLQHLTSAKCELMGHIIPKGTIVLPNLHGVHMDPETWQNPEQFYPHRHIDENGKFVASNKIIPFSVGPRFCIGESLARAEIFIFFVKILQHFKIRPAKEIPPINNELVTVVISPKECMICAESKH